MRRKISQDHDHAGGSSESARGLKEISQTLSRDAARREHLFAAVSEANLKPALSRPEIRPSNVVVMAEPDAVWKAMDPKEQLIPDEPTAVDIAGSMFVASAELVLSTLEELKFHIRALRTKEEIDGVLAVRIERWREAVLQFRAERSRGLPGGE